MHAVLMVCILEMTIGKGFPMGIAIPWEFHRNRNNTSTRGWEGVGMNIDGNGPYSHGKIFPWIVCRCNFALGCRPIVQTLYTDIQVDGSVSSDMTFGRVTVKYFI